MKRFLNIYTVIAIVGIAAIGFLAFGFSLLLSDKVPDKAIVTRVIDGDTIEIEGGYRVRYIGIDAPEEDEYYFKEALAKNAELVLGKKVRLKRDVSETDKYGRLLCYVYVGDLFVNAELVRMGYANAVKYDPDVKYSNYFTGLEQYAVSSKLGIHASSELKAKSKSSWLDEFMEDYRKEFREKFGIELPPAPPSLFPVR
ncbi:MAG: thermonuclease family protein [Dehalococcoidales bacterium]|nr:thermonuclease family protein [Dehalococcoidales bacterium]